jgi:competence transcription factor ComK
MNKNQNEPVVIDFSKLLHCEGKELIGEVVARSCNVIGESLIGREGNQVNLNHLILESNEAVVTQHFDS